MRAPASNGPALHLAEYALEALLLGVFLFVACLLGVLLDHPAASIRAALPDPFARRALFGLGTAAVPLAPEK